MNRRGLRIMLASAIALSAIGTTSSAFAQFDVPGFFNSDELPPVGQPNARGCVRECPNDNNPCDSFAKKQIDGRCKHGG